MKQKEIIELIKIEFPEKAIDLSESLELLNETINDTMNSINEKVNEAFQLRDFSEIDKYKELTMAIHHYEKNIEELIKNLEVETQEPDIEDSDEDVEKRQIPNYAEYLVDTNVEHTLYEDFTHKRPCGFKINERQIIEVTTWKEMLVKTCEFLITIDKAKFMSFENINRMNGKKRKYFSTDPSKMTEPKTINNEIYVETLMSSNGFRNLIIKLLKEYEFKVNEYKIYLRADYSDLNRDKVSL